MKIAALFVFAFVATVAEKKYSCYVRTYYAKKCYHFEFAEDCQPWQLDRCKPVRVTTSDFRCAKYFCVSILIEYFNFELKASTILCLMQ